jgi:signal transduction histidine kinase
LQSAIQQSGCLLKMQVPSQIELESFQGPLGQVLSNLVMNATRHAFAYRSGGIITISARTLDADQVEIVVADDGDGISPGALERIFDPFFTTQLGKGGSGLGLAITLNLVTRVLGGTISAESELGAGTRMTVLLPRVASL